MSALSPVETLYDKVNALFGHKDGQLFTFEYPGRILDMGTYAYKGSDLNNAQDIKPEQVGEAEFLLSDDLYTVGQITGGPKGTRLSTIYAELLGSFIPTGTAESDYDKFVVPDQDKIIAWLLAPVPDWTPPTVDILAELFPDHMRKKKIPKRRSPEPAKPPEPASLGSETKQIARIDLYQKLLSAYEEEDFRWRQFKLNLRPKNKIEDGPEWEEYNRVISNYGAVVDAQLEGLWQTLVVRGQYHRIRHFVGLVDVTSASESLLAAKESLRSSVSRSVDGSGDIYPVLFSPASWANYLTTDFTPNDLFMSPAALRASLSSKEDLRRTLSLRLQQLKNGQASSPQVEELQRRVDTASQNLNAAQTKLTMGYTDSFISLVKLYFKTPQDIIDKAGSINSFNDILRAAKFTDIQQTVFETLRNNQQACLDAANDVQNAQEALVGLRGQLAGAKASDVSAAILQCQGQIDQLTVAIESLKEVLAAAPPGVDPLNPNATVPPPTGNLIPPPPPTNGASEWQSVTMESSTSSSNSTTSLSTTSSQFQAGVSLFFGSASVSGHSSSATSSNSFSSLSMDIKIGMNVMKVDMTRPWFDPSIFAQTAGFYRVNNSKPISGGAAFLDVLNSPTSTPDQRHAALTAAEDHLLPTYPVSFIVAKDVTISITITSASSTTKGSDVESAIQSSGGFMCFSCSNASSSTSTSSSAFTKSDATHVEIRIPGPQIIGWILQAVPADESPANYTPLDKNVFDPPKPNAAK